MKGNDTVFANGNWPESATNGPATACRAVVRAAAEIPKLGRRILPSRVVGGDQRGCVVT